MIPPWSSAPSSRGGGLTTMGQATEIRPAAGQLLAQLLSRSCRKGPGTHHQALQELGLPRADQGIKHFVISSWASSRHLGLAAGEQLGDRLGRADSRESMDVISLIGGLQGLRAGLELAATALADERQRTPPTD